MREKNKYGLSYFYPSNTFPSDKIEIGIDEAGRGPLFGPLFVAAVVLPKDGSFDYSEIRDSKKITSLKKRRELAKYIQENAVFWSIHAISAEEIDQINIRQAVLKGMRTCIRDILSNPLLEKEPLENIFLMVDGNDFPPYIYFDESTEISTPIAHNTITGGDNLFVPIACASILAKCARDEYILELCLEHPELKTHYRIDQNMGYGTKHHLDGILVHGITEWHRKTYGRCKTMS
jgi:ribonuclease HII